MITLIHGDDTVKIHAHCVSLLAAAKERNVYTVRLDGKGLTVTDLETAIGTQELFASEKVVAIDRLHSLPKSKLKEQLLTWIVAHDAASVHTILVEEKLLTPTQIKLFGKSTVVTYKLPLLLFTFIEQIGVLPTATLISQFHSILETQEAEFVFAMLIRQVRLLLSYISDGTFSGPPFAKNKLQKQAATFSLDKLLKIHAELVRIDYEQKTSRSSLTLPQEIDLLIARL